KNTYKTGRCCAEIRSMFVRLEAGQVVFLIKMIRFTRNSDRKQFTVELVEQAGRQVTHRGSLDLQKQKQKIPIIKTMTNRVCSWLLYLNPTRLGARPGYIEIARLKSRFSAN